MEVVDYLGKKLHGSEVIGQGNALRENRAISVIPR